MMWNPSGLMKGGLLALQALHGLFLCVEECFELTYHLYGDVVIISAGCTGRNHIPLLFLIEIPPWGGIMNHFSIITPSSNTMSNH